MFQCQTYKCTINAHKEGEASLQKKKKKVLVVLAVCVFDRQTTTSTKPFANTCHSLTKMLLKRQ